MQLFKEQLYLRVLWLPEGRFGMWPIAVSVLGLRERGREPRVAGLFASETEQDQGGLQLQELEVSEEVLRVFPGTASVQWHLQVHRLQEPGQRREQGGEQDGKD